MPKLLACLIAISSVALLMTLNAHAQSDNQGLSDADKKFMNEAAMGGMAEVKLGQLAVEKGANADVKKFGQKMIDDHSKANEELMNVAKAENYTLPTTIGKNQKTYDKLAKLSGMDFDKAYVKDMVEDHQADVKAFEKQAERGQDHDLKTWAAKTLPMIQEHLTIIQGIDKAMNGK